MKLVPILSCSVVLVCTVPGRATDGYAVTSVMRWTCSGSIPETAFGYAWTGDDTDNDHPGRILRATIRNDAVESLDTIYKTTYAKYPVINLTGTKVAMYRYEARMQDNAIVDLDKPRHISVMDIDGSNVRDLVTFTVGDVEGGGEHFIVLDWTAGDWIYYTVPRHHYPSDPCPIWRVQADNPSTNQHVYTYNDPAFTNLARWHISADGTRATLMGNWAGGYTNMCSDFPPTRIPVPEHMGGEYPNVCCCNISVSPTGLRMGRFIDGAHVNVFLGEWDANDVMSVSGQDAVQLSSISEWAGEHVGDGMGMTSWSSNSDKWYCVMPAACRTITCGGNQVLVNHIDQKAIMTTHNENVTPGVCPSSTVIAATAGDFWVQPPAGSEGRIETESGTWVTVATGAAEEGMAGRGHPGPGSRRQMVHNNDIITGMSMENPGDFVVELCSTSGRCLRRFKGTAGRLNIPRSAMLPGIILARIIDENTGVAETIVLNAR